MPSGFNQVSIDGKKVSLGFIAVYRVLLGFTEFNRVSNEWHCFLTSSDWWEKGFTGFYWGLPSCTVFHRVQSNSIRFRTSATGFLIEFRLMEKGFTGFFNEVYRVLLGFSWVPNELTLSTVAMRWPTGAHCGSVPSSQTILSPRTCCGGRRSAGLTVWPSRNTPCRTRPTASFVNPSIPKGHSLTLSMSPYSSPWTAH